MANLWVRKMLAALVLLGFGGYFLLVKEGERSEGLQYVDLAAQRAVLERGALGNSADPPPFEPGEADAEAAPQSEFSIPSLRCSVRGRVVDASGNPLPGIGVQRIHAFLSEARTESGAEGRFELTLEEPQGELTASGSGWILIGGERYLAAEREDDYLLVLAPAVEFRGRLIDTRGAPVSDASLYAIPAGDALVRFGLVAPPLEHESQHGWSEPDGSFRLGPLPFLPGGRIEVSAPGSSPVEFPQPADPSQPIEIVIGER